jgi:hypothetical protein
MCFSKMTCSFKNAQQELVFFKCDRFVWMMVAAGLQSNK